MKRIILAMICPVILGLVGCDSNTNKSHYKYEEFNSPFGETYTSTFKDSKSRPHRVVIFTHSWGLSTIDLDANTYK